MADVEVAMIDPAIMQGFGHRRHLLDKRPLELRGRWSLRPGTAQVLEADRTDQLVGDQE